MLKWLGCGTLLAASACEFPKPADVGGYVLTVDKSGPGAAAGSVTSAPGAIDCGATCVASFDVPTPVTLTAAASAGAYFTGWSGDGCSGTDPCVLTVDREQHVTANFGARVRLTVARAGAGSGTVTGAGIDCGADCQEEVEAGTMVTLTATPAAGERFFGWSGGGCTGTSACTVTVDAATTVTATFDQCDRGAVTCSTGTGRLDACGPDGAYVSYAVPNGGVDGSPTTLVMHDYACPMGCHASEPRCLDVSASNGLNAALDDAATSPAGLDLRIAEAGETVIDTRGYDPVNHTIQLAPPSGSPVTVPARVITQSGGPEILVLEVRTFTLAAGATLVVRGTRALGVTSHFDIYIAGHLKASGAVGGAGQATATIGYATDSGFATGGGGNFGGGGSSSNNVAGGVGTASDSMTPLAGGSGGGAITSAGGPPRSEGGGAVQLVSRSRMVLAATAIINVSGKRGLATIDPAGVTAFATGGGSGGSVLVESPGLAMAPGSIVVGRGGSGAAARISPPMVAVGRDGDDATNAGATCTGCGTGGAGATEFTTGGGSGIGTSPAIGGGGGGVGRALLRTRTGSASVPSGSMHLHLLPTLSLSSR